VEGGGNLKKRRKGERRREVIKNLETLEDPKIVEIDGGGGYILPWT